MSNEFKLVPVEPTEEMLNSVTTTTNVLLRAEIVRMAKHDWASMLAAATQPPALGGEPRRIPDEDESVSLEWSDGHNTACDAWKHYLAPLKAELDRQRALEECYEHGLKAYEGANAGLREELVALKAQRDELESSRAEIEIVIPKGCGCLNVEMGSYDNQLELKTPEFILELGAVGCLSFRETTCVDACVAPLVLALWAQGVVTTGACCGHNQQDGYVGIYRPALSKPAGSEQV